MNSRFFAVLFGLCSLTGIGTSAAFAQAPTGNPVSVPLKIWVTAEVGVMYEPLAHWRMTLEGDFLPTQPGGSRPPGAVTEGWDGEIVERMVTLNSVPCEPYREYTLDFSGEGFWNGKFCVAAPVGYRVEIDGQPRNALFWDNSGGALGWDAHPVVRIIPDDIGPARPAGTPTSFKTGLVDWRVSLGALKDGSSAGEIALRGPGWGSDLISTPLVYTGPAFQGSYEATMQWVPLTAPAYELRFYHPSQVTITPQTYPTPDITTITGEPFVVYKVEAPTATSLKITRTTRDIPDATTTGISPARVEETTLTRSGSWPSFTWTVSDWTVQGGTTQTEIFEEDGGTTSNRTANLKVRAPGGSAVYDTTLNYTLQPWGEALTSVVQNATTETLTTSITHDTNASDSSFNSYGYPTSQILPNGAWEAYSYDYVSSPDDRSRAGLITSRNRPWKGLPATPATGDSDGEMTIYGYSPDVFNFPTRPAGTLTKINGKIIERTNIAYTNAGTLTGTSLALLDAQRREFVESSGAYLESTVRYFREDCPDPFLLKKTHSITRADGTKTVYAYQRGYWNGATFQLTDYNGLAPAFLSSPPGPVGSRITAIDGTAASGTLYSTHDGYDIDNVYLVTGKSTMQVAIRDERALVRRTESHVWTGSAWQLASYVNYSYNFVGQPTGTVASNGATTECHYHGALKDYEIDASGVRIDYTYDDAGRVRDVTKAAGGGIGALTTRYTYDAAGRVIQQQTGVLTGGIFPGESLSTYRTFDQAGRPTSETPPGLGTTTTTIAYNTASRTRTVTRPDGGTLIETSYPEGRLLSVTGSAVVPEYYTYEVDNSGIRYLRVNSGSSNSPRFRESWTDLLGRTFKTSRPGFTGQGAFVEQSSYDASTGRLSKIERTGYAPTLFEYDELSHVKRTGLGISNPNGPLNPGSNDRIVDLDQRLDPADSTWWLSETKLYPLANNPATITTSSRQRLSGFSGNLQAETRSTDAENNTSVTTTQVDRSAKTITVATTQPGFSGSVSQVYTNGLPTNVTGFDALSSSFQYDALSRLWKSIDSRTHATTTEYYSGTALVHTITDAAGAAASPAYANATYGYDSTGRAIWSQDATGIYSYFDYNARGQLVHQWGAGTYPTEYGYDVTYGDRTTLKTYRGGTGWENNSWPTAPGTADTTTWGYHADTGLLTSKTDAASHAVGFTYNARGQLATRAWARGVTTTYAYDGNTGDATGISYSDGTPTIGYTYTRIGQVDSVSDVTGTRDFVYDPSKPWRLSVEAMSGFYGSRAVTPLYEASGAIGRAYGFQLGASAGSNSDLEQTWGFTGAGRFDALASKRSSNSLSRTFQYGYRTDAALVNALSVTGGHPFAVSYEYEALRDLVTKVDSTWSGVSRTRYDYTYNALGQRATAKQSSSLDPALGAFADFGDSTYQRYLYNPRGELTDATDYLGGDPSSTTAPQLSGRHHAYTYDTIGNRLTASRTGSAGNPDDFTSNGLNQYISRENNYAHTAGTAATGSVITASGTNSASVSSIGRQGSYWDAQVSLNNTGGPALSTLTITATLAGAGTNGANLVRSDNTRIAALAKALQTFSYDDDGNLTTDGVWNYVYDGENQLIQMTTTTVAAAAGFPNRTLEFKYDYLGRRVQKHSLNAGVHTYRRYLYDGANLVAEFDAPSGTSCGTLLRSFTWGLDLAGSIGATGGVGALLQLTDHATGVSYLPTYDGNGNVASLLNADTGTIAAKYEYSPFGELLRAEGVYAANNPFRFSTKFIDDESGLVYYGHRYYAPSLGRFINRDSIEEAGGLNLYGFCGNDGVNQIDVGGHDIGSMVFDWLRGGANSNPNNPDYPWYKVDNGLDPNETIFLPFENTHSGGPHSDEILPGNYGPAYGSPDIGGDYRQQSQAGAASKPSDREPGMQGLITNNAVLLSYFERFQSYQGGFSEAGRDALVAQAISLWKARGDASVMTLNQVIDLARTLANLPEIYKEISGKIHSAVDAPDGGKALSRLTGYAMFQVALILATPGDGGRPNIQAGESRLANLQSKFESLAEEHLLPKYRAIDPTLEAGYVGSFRTGTVGNPSKVTFGQPINLSKFDIDYWIKSDALFEKFGNNLRADVFFRKILSEVPGFEGLKPNKQGFSISFKPATK